MSSSSLDSNAPIGDLLEPFQPLRRLDQEGIDWYDIAQQKDEQLLGLYEKMEAQRKFYEAEIALLRGCLLEALDNEKDPRNIRKEHSIFARATSWLQKSPSRSRSSSISSYSTVGTTRSESQCDDEFQEPAQYALPHRHPTAFELSLPVEAMAPRKDQAQSIGSQTCLISTESEPVGDLLEPFHADRRQCTSGVTSSLQEQPQNIVEDDELFRQLKKNLEATKLITSVDAVQGSHLFTSNHPKDTTAKKRDGGIGSGRYTIQQDCHDGIPSSIVVIKRSHGAFCKYSAAA